ncbi:MAG: ATP-grasp domain-containing protein [bacterium]|nr:ATP-grasp domain-containing protein [bacterium]
MTKKPVNVLLVAAGSPGDVTIIRGLKQSPRYDVTLYAADIDPYKGNLYLPEVDRAYVIPRYDAPNYRETLLELVRRLRIDVLISDLDEELPALSDFGPQLEEAGCRIVLPGSDGLATCLDKLATFRRLDGRVPQPLTLDGDDGEAGRNLLRSLGRVILKARYLRGGRGVDLVSSEAEYAFYEELHRKRGPFVVQEFAEGDEYNCSSLHDMEGNLIYAATRVKLEDRLNKANTIAARIVEQPAIRKTALETLRALGLERGFNNVEVILAGGEPKVVDVNGGRWAGQDMNLLASGINPAELYLDLALGRDVSPLEVPLGATSLKIKVDVVVDAQRISQVERIGGDPQ